MATLVASLLQCSPTIERPELARRSKFGSTKIGKPGRRKDKHQSKPPPTISRCLCMSANKVSAHRQLAQDNEWLKTH